jgi:hypothetical protein
VASAIDIPFVREQPEPIRAPSSTRKARGKPE